jgi:preprotein translocase subunit SecE
MDRLGWAPMFVAPGFLGYLSRIPKCDALVSERHLHIMSGVVMAPAKFLREVRAEIGKVTWPSRKETLVTTGLVFAMAALAALFFFIADQIIGIGVRALFGVGL